MAGIVTFLLVFYNFYWSVKPVRSSISLMCCWRFVLRDWMFGSVFNYDAMLGFRDLASDGEVTNCFKDGTRIGSQLISWLTMRLLDLCPWSNVALMFPFLMLNGDFDMILFLMSSSCISTFGKLSLLSRWYRLSFDRFIENAFSDCLRDRLLSVLIIEFSLE